ncbi:GAF and ANTAR domain-containing protein [Kribbella lupini]|uniref:GAF domain-containing protein n=1 Tax=Kribbella lupini TaxID=291602 RepID=A0ABN2AHN2_9ACTN
MTAVTAAQAFADAAAAMVSQHDTTDTLAHLLTSYADLTGAAAAGMLVKDDHGQLELLSATSHQAGELELYQLQHDTGPCVEAFQSGTAVNARSDEIGERWGDVGTAILSAGFHAVVAVPLRWHGQVLGAMNAFHRTPESVDEETRLLSQAFADVASMVIVQTELSTAQVEERIRTVLGGRTVVELAKGVLAHTTGLDMAAAYRLLVERALDNGTTLSETADDVIRQAQHRD